MLQSSQRSPARFRSFSQPQFSDGLMQSPLGSQPSNAYAPITFPASQPTSGYHSNGPPGSRPLIPRRRLLQPSSQPPNLSQHGLQSSQLPGYRRTANLPPVAQARVAGSRNLQIAGGIDSAEQTPSAGVVSQKSPQQQLPTSQIQSGMRLDSTQQTHYHHSRLGLHRSTQELGSQEFPQPARNAQDHPLRTPLQINQHK